MGQKNSNEVLIEKYVNLPFMTKEDVYQIKNCFEYLNPKGGVVELDRLDRDLEDFPEYMQDIIQDMKALNTQVTFNDFFNIMKPRIIAMKNLPDDSIIMENTSTSVFCVICPYKAPHEQNSF
jgi:hypothetical protein